MKCIACGTEFSQDGTDVSCPNCHTQQIQTGGTAVSANAAQKQVDPGLSYAELLEKLKEAVEDLDAMIENRKILLKTSGEDIKDQGLYIRDIQRLLKKKKGQQ